MAAASVAVARWGERSGRNQPVRIMVTNDDGISSIGLHVLARTMRRWHDGTDMGAVWQVVIFLGGIIPALLSVTGIIIWWRARRARRRAQGLKPATA